MNQHFYPWQIAQWEQLQNYRQQNRLPQALLMIGQKGIGKLQLAKVFAFSLFCEQPQQNFLACGHCSSCRLALAQTHPDLIEMQPEEEGKNITIAQIRQLNERLALKPQFETPRVVLIYPADNLNNAAANGFLKCLEEPSERTMIILISEKLQKLPATIISRCQKLLFPKPEKDSVINWLNQQGVVQHIDILLHLAQGSPLLAANYAKENYIQQRFDCFSTWIDVLEQKTLPIVVAENWQKLPESLLLTWLISWVADLIKRHANIAPSHLINPDFFQHFQKLSFSPNVKKLYALYDLLLLNRQRIDTQINKQLLFEELLILSSQLKTA